MDQDALNVLQRIEALLKRNLATVSAPERPTPGPRRVAGGRRADETERQIFRATKQLTELGNQAARLSKTLSSTRSDLVGARGSVRSFSSAALSAANQLNDAVASALSTIAARSKVKPAKADKQLAAVADSSRSLAPRFDALVRSASRLHRAFGLLSKQLGQHVGVTKQAGAQQTQATKATRKGAQATTQATAATRAAAASTTASASAFTRAVTSLTGGMGKSVMGFTGNLDWAEAQLRVGLLNLKEGLIGVVRDIFMLQSRGISAAESLTELYITAAKAGMSLQEYTAMLEDNSAALVRSRSIEDFSKELSSTTRALNRLGVFGPAAEQLAASLRTSAVTLGIPASQQAKATEAQVKVFEQLRRTTLMTADAFRELVLDVAANQNVQEDLLGLAPAERQARMQQLLQTATLGQQLGLTKEASRSLSEALLAQRRATAEERFQAAGVIRQAGAILGLQGEAEELARLRLKKRRTPEEEARFVELSGLLEQGIQGMMNTGNIQAEFIAEKLSQLIGGTPQAAVQQAAAAAALQKQAGPVIAQDIGKQTSDTMQSVGRALTVLTGFMKNPLADAMVTFSAMLAQLGVQVFMLNRIHTAILRTGGIGGPGAPGGPVGPGGKAPPGKAGRAGSIVTTAVTATAGVASAVFSAIASPLQALSGVAGTLRATVGGAASSVMSYAQYLTKLNSSLGAGHTVMKIFSDALSAAKGGISGLATGIRSFLGSGGWLAGVFSLFEELFTGEVTKALSLGDGIFGRLLGAVIAGFNGIFTGVTRLFDGAVNWIMEGLGLSFRVNTTKLVDYVTGIIVDGWKLITAVMMKGLASLLEALPFVSKDAPWVKSLREGAARVDDSLMESSRLREEMWKTEGATLRSMGEKTQKAQVEAADKTKKGADALASSLSRVTDLQGLATSASVTAASLTQQAQVAAPTIAQPQPPLRPSIVPPEVNTQPAAQAGALATRLATATADEAAGKKPPLDVTGMQDLVTTAQQQLAVLKQILALDVGKEAAAGAVLPQLPRPALSNSPDLYDRVIRAA